MTEYVDFALSDLVYIQSFRLNMGVCLCLCLSVSALQPKRLGRF